jgi:activator of 2-hydroxyglutaryl-CoA dehydratase
MDKGAFIMHRCHGCTTDINPSGTHAVTKLKATITQRFVIDDIEFDVEADCRFCFFFEKVDGRWGARLVRHWYEKDKIIPANPSRIPSVDEEKVKRYPPGYRYLAYFQEATMGAKVLMDMPGHRRHVGTQNLEKHDLLYRQAKKWLEDNSLEV